jgi:hypothetical protein
MHGVRPSNVYDLELLFRECVRRRFYMATPQAMRAPPPPRGAGWSE